MARVGEGHMSTWADYLGEFGGDDNTADSFPTVLTSSVLQTVNRVIPQAFPGTAFHGNRPVDTSSISSVKCD